MRPRNAAERMVIKTAAAIPVALLLSACAPTTTPNNFGGERTVFYNPYAAPELSNGPVGPDQCEGCPGDGGRYLDGLFYPGAGQYAFTRAGKRIRLSRAERRQFRDRFRALNQRIELERSTAAFNARQVSVPPKPVPSAPPISAPQAPSQQNAGAAIEP